MVSVVNSFLSYLVLMLVILAVGGVAVAIGITLRKRKNAQTAVEDKTEE